MRARPSSEPKNADRPSTYPKHEYQPLVYVVRKAPPRERTLVSENNAGIYSKYPHLYDIVYGNSTYEDDVKMVLELVAKELPDAATMLDVACGTGLHLTSLKERFEINGVDFEEGMLEIAREKFPEISFQQADMRDFDLGRTFDLVISFGNSVGYMTSPEELDAALASIGRHVREGGMLLIEPWLWPERFWVDRYTGGYVEHDDGNLAWMQHADQDGDLSVFDIHWVFQSPDGIVHFQDNESMGLFTNEQYQAAFTKAGMEVSYDPEPFGGYGMYIGRKTSTA